MSRVAQLGVFAVVLGGVVLFLAFFPYAVDADFTPGIGLSQILGILTGTFLLVAGAYLFVYALLHRGRPDSLLADIAIRMGMTGLVFAFAATLADLLGFGSHIASEGSLFGWLQALGMMAGFIFAALGVFLYGYAGVIALEREDEG
ncbi:MAG: hypothetical protein GYB64_02355 [Chloroflexi bacterium]|nr:hypothetical protein [Chloroflexota bacterium]